MSTITLSCMVCGLGYDIHHNLTLPARFTEIVSNCPGCGMKNVLKIETEIGCPDCGEILTFYPDYLYCKPCKQIWKECAYRFCHELFKPSVTPHTRHRYHLVECRLLENTHLEKKRKVKRNKKAKFCHNCGRNPVPKGNYWLCDNCYRQGDDITEYNVNI